MKRALFSDLHYDETGLEKLLKHDAFFAADERVCLGDIINAQSKPDERYFECVASISDAVLMGNHEAVLVNLCEIDVFSPKVREAIQATKTLLESQGQSFLEKLRSLPRELTLSDTHATHASFNPQSPWHHVRYTEDVQAEEGHLPAQVNFLAHGHVPFLAWKENGYWYYERSIYNRTFMLKPNAVYVVNSGSVLGSREMRHYEKTFLVYDDRTAAIQFYNLEDK